MKKSKKVAEVVVEPPKRKNLDSTFNVIFNVVESELFRSQEVIESFKKRLDEESITNAIVWRGKDVIKAEFIHSQFKNLMSTICPTTVPESLEKHASYVISLFEGYVNREIEYVVGNSFSGPHEVDFNSTSQFSNLSELYRYNAKLTFVNSVNVFAKLLKEAFDDHMKDVINPQ